MYERRTLRRVLSSFPLAKFDSMANLKSKTATPMPAQQRLQEETVNEDLPQNDGGIPQAKREESDDGNLEEPQVQNDDSDSSDDDLGDDEFLDISLPEMRKVFQCPICLGIIRKTRTVQTCMHRFCRECVDKAMRLGNKECPTCRTHCASRRSLRDDPNYDKLIALFFPDIDKYEEEELALNEEEAAQKKQVQAMISQTVERQSEALNRKRKRSKSSRQRRISCPSNDNEVANDNSSFAEERRETRSKRRRRSKGEQSTTIVSDGGDENENNSEENKDIVCAFPSVGLVGSSELLGWGRGGIRSHSRYPKNGRIAKLANHLRHMDMSHEPDIQILVVSLDVEKEKAPALEQPYLCCKPTLSVGQICEFIAFQTSSRVEDIEILVVKEPHSKISSLIPSEVQPSGSFLLNAREDELQPLNSDQTVHEVKSTSNLRLGHLVLAYRRRLADPGASQEVVAGHQSS